MVPAVSSPELCSRTGVRLLQLTLFSGERLMSQVDEATLARPSKTPEKPAAFMAQKRPVVLDMGEASREQGFRMNGCR